MSTISDTPDTTFEDRAKAYEGNFTAANKTVSDRASKTKPAKADLKKLAEDIVMDEAARNKYDVLKDIFQAETRLHRHIDGKADERDLIAKFQKELKALTDDAGKKK